MSSRPRSFVLAWLLSPLLALVVLIAIDAMRINRVHRATDIAEWSVNPPAPDNRSATGYAANQRRLIVPAHNNESQQLIAQTQQTVATGALRLRRVDYDNAPLGRETHLPAPCRWWLATMAWLDRLFSDRSPGMSVEHAALFSDPALHVLLLIATTLFVARKFGSITGAITSLGIVSLFPFAGEFLPGAPDHHGLAVACALWSVLPLVAGIRPTETHARFWFSLAGIAGGFGLWIDPAIEVPILVGIALGAALHVALNYDNATAAASWRLWALAGAAMSIAGYFVEYFPGEMHLRLEANHPLYAIAWVGVGELLVRLSNFVGGQKRRRDLIAALLAVAAVTALPMAMVFTDSRGFLKPDPAGVRLSYASDVAAKNLFDWITRDGVDGKILATFLPLLLVSVGTVVAFRKMEKAERAAVIFALGPLLITLAFAFFQLRWFGVLGAIVLATLVVLVGAKWKSRWVSAVVFLAIAPSLAQFEKPVLGVAGKSLSEIDVEQVIERDLSHWLAKRSGGSAIVLASPDLTTALHFHGGLRGLGTLDWENKDGLAAAVRIVSATSPQEALALVQQRGVTHIVMPSWDTSLEDFAKLGSSLAERSFVTALKKWAPLVWLRPLPYRLPQIGGFEGQSVVIFEVVDEQDEVTTLAAQAEYFVEMGMTDAAAVMRKKLQRFPGDLNALVALAYIEGTGTDLEALRAVFNQVVTATNNGADRTLAWERRVSLAGVLAHGNRMDLAREQVRRCLAEIDQTRVRTLSSGSLFRLLALGKKFGIEIPDPKLREFARGLIPPDAQSRL